MSKSIKNEFTDQLFEAILLLEDKEECYNFFKDIRSCKNVKTGYNI